MRRDEGLGYRDLGCRRRACMMKGIPDPRPPGSAVSHCGSCPQAVGFEPVPAPIRDRADFKAIFQPR